MTLALEVPVLRDRIVDLSDLAVDLYFIGDDHLRTRIMTLVDSLHQKSYLLTEVDKRRKATFQKAQDDIYNGLDMAISAIKEAVTAVKNAAGFASMEEYRFKYLKGLNKQADQTRNELRRTYKEALELVERVILQLGYIY